MKFELTADQLKQFNDWRERNKPDLYCGAIGGRYTYTFTNYSIGQTVIVKDNLKNIELDLSDYEW